MLDNQDIIQDIINEVNKLTETERNSTAIAFIILQLKEVEKAIKEIKKKLQAMENVKTVLDDLQENQQKFSLVLKQHEDSIQKLEKKNL